MKKIILATATFFCIGAASAQKKTNDVHFGLRAGVNFANIIKDGDNDFLHRNKTRLQCCSLS